ncbi:MAG TPA: hypothetical protein VFQ60_01830, partial [Patescibacteria group bacterium]|nr:hypothetical protein [Patescibacteria group bacterium]
MESVLRGPVNPRRASLMTTHVTIPTATSSRSTMFFPLLSLLRTHEPNVPAPIQTEAVPGTLAVTRRRAHPLGAHRGARRFEIRRERALGR